MNSIVIFCGSSKGTERIYEEQAYLLGKTLADLGIGLVYGGAKVGLMGAVADGALQHGGRVIGVLPYFLQTKEIAHDSLTELILVDTMHERKTKMNQLSDGVIALPGGFGTLEELFEMLTWGQLGLHQKPMGLLNTDGFYDELIALARHMVDKGFLKEINQQMLLWSADIQDLLNQMRNYQPPAVGKWITQEAT
ncbi:cytokinin riboside 5'-monophosphate phosphoribohydrolase [Parapedobacter pyrenivorans]|uniref:Cytokinin riboside 5'-monophosphate phosphoribohydrolase n=1 Tax=Parapedobacter pyrenivorans TaxID=1305674 RepID=A0A917MES5_9SPHI|nr:TIGR00730 family Rossman fold protein [Parapedobacter pyrenivorans]GGG94217.1 cytokinin riboside 5'-monophosphate phosphoribohydrolase [Parapedobacter pyrenivorans]